MVRKCHTPLDVIVDRLRHSSNPIERRSLYTGRTYHQGFPVLLDTDNLVEHMHLVGPPGSGKTSLGIETIARQLVARNDGPLVIFDGKGDIGLFNSVRHAAHLCGRKFKWFTNRPGRSTYVFNPWDNRLLKRLTLTDLLGLITQSLNLHHGQDYGRAWFSVNIRNRLRQAILATVPDADRRPIVNTKGQRRLFPEYGPIQSFRDLLEVLKSPTHDTDEYKAAQHLTFVVESLCDFDQLNLAPSTDPNHPALDHAIFMPEVIEKKQVVYFYLAGAIDNAAVSEIAKLALYSLFTAAGDYCEKYGKKPRIYTIWDEAQIMIAKNIENVLAQSRSYGMACILAHQAMSQLNPPGGVDLRDLVMQCTLIKQVFGARDPWLMEYISRTAGITKYYRRGYDLSPADTRAGRIDPVHACRDHDDQQRVHVQEFTGPRLSYQDISDASYHPNLSLMSIGQPSKLCPFRGWFPMYTDWPVPSSVHEAYERQPWPKKSDATIETKRLWPTDDGPAVATPDSICPTGDSPAVATPDRICPTGDSPAVAVPDSTIPCPDQPKVADTLDGVWQDMQHTRAILSDFS